MDAAAASLARRSGSPQAAATDRHSSGRMRAPRMRVPRRQGRGGQPRGCAVAVGALDRFQQSRVDSNLGLLHLCLLLRAF